MTVSEKTAENRLRRRLRTQGYLLRKSRARFSGDNLGGYMIVDAKLNAIVRGWRFNMSLDDVEQFLSE